jgi:hypothetical protein
MMDQLERDTRAACPFLCSPHTSADILAPSAVDPFLPSSSFQWKEIRVFVSSTFKDYHAEREILMNSVFPRLRDWCHQRSLLLAEVDLRWGVPAQSSTGTTLRACLGEIDRCYDTNGSPFFINMLGHRYGWIPSPHDVPDDVRASYEWIDGASVTHMEIVHATFRKYNPNAFFLIRDPSFLQNLPPEILSDFIEPSPSSSSSPPPAAASLNLLKSLVREAYQGTNQVMDYLPQFNGIETLSTDLPKVRLSQMNQFSETILQFLQSAIDRQYPLPAERAEGEEEGEDGETTLLNHIKRSLSSQQEQLVVEKGRSLIGRDVELAVLFQYLISPAEAPSPTLIPIPSNPLPYWIFGTHSNCPILVHSPRPSLGKSALLSSLFLLLQDHHPSSFPSTFFHSFQTLDNDLSLPNNLTLFLFRFCSQFGNELIQVKLLKALTTYPSLANISDNHLLELAHEIILHNQYSSSLSLPLIVLIDELNFPYDFPLGVDVILRLFPLPLPPHLRVIFSSSNHTIFNSFIKSLLHLSSLSNLLSLSPLPHAALRTIVKNYFERFNKCLDSTQLSILLSHSSASQNMEWLSLACDTIRVFGAFETVNQYISSLPSTTEELLLKYLMKLESLSDHLSPSLSSSSPSFPESHHFSLFFHSTIHLLLASRTGLVESEIRILLHMIATDAFRLPPTHQGVEQPSLPWNDLLSALFPTPSSCHDPMLTPIPYHDWSVLYSFLKIFLKVSSPLDLTSTRFYRPYQPRYVLKSSQLRELVSSYYHLTPGGGGGRWDTRTPTEKKELKYYSLKIVELFRARGAVRVGAETSAEARADEGDQLRRREEYPFQLLSCQLYHELHDYISSSDWQHISFIDQRVIMKSIRCSQTITPCPPSPHHPPSPRPPSLSHSHQVSLPSKEFMCLNCSMKSVMTPGGRRGTGTGTSRLRRQCCHLCGNGIHSIYFITGAHCRVQLNPMESYCYQCRLHHPKYYQPATTGGSNPMRSIHPPTPPHAPRPTGPTNTLPNGQQLDCIYCKLPISNSSPALPVIQCHFCSLHGAICSFTEQRDQPI